MDLRSVSQTGWHLVPGTATARTFDIIEPAWRPEPALRPRGDAGAAVGHVEIVAADYVLHRLDGTGAIECSEIIDADTIAGALRQVVDRVDRSERADYELWMGHTKVASIEATGNPGPMPRATPISWWQRMFAR